MTKLQKKKTGKATGYISRNQALKKLQVSLPDFRRLCILKGIYPREPKNKKKVTGGSTALKTYYHEKDIRFLMHEPILGKFREFKAFVKKLKKAVAKHEHELAESLEGRQPVYKLDHLVRERYPSFVDAIKDLDDALCMIFLFRKMPQHDHIEAKVAKDCERLANEFMYYCVSARRIRKVFISIKGYYYQADIKGVPVTWLVPHYFSQSEVPIDVDFRVMLTFLEFQRTLLSFVNYRLYKDQGLAYPPKFDADRVDAAGGFNAMQTEKLGSASLETKKTTVKVAATVDENDEQVKESEERVKQLEFAMSHITEKDEKEATKTSTTGADKDEGDDDEGFEEMEGDDAETYRKAKSLQAEKERKRTLFEGLRLYISREVPREPFEFVARSFGAQVGWAPTAGGHTPFSENDGSITHQIIDRPAILNDRPGRAYIQPQWVFDCVNTGKLLPVEQYKPGALLPPHLSPFVEESAFEYVPPERRAELDDDLLPTEEREAKKAAEKIEKIANAEDEEITELRKSMMSKKHRRLYDRIMYSRSDKQAKAEKLTKKREAYEAKQKQDALAGNMATKQKVVNASGKKSAKKK
eukprot:Clim_evm20s167 gene=Clim_evmTU20s167